MNKKLYPPKCSKCGQFISNEEFEKDKVATKQNYYNFGGLDIWFEHKFNCKEMMKNYES